MRINEGLLLRDIRNACRAHIDDVVDFLKAPVTTDGMPESPTIATSGRMIITLDHFANGQYFNSDGSSLRDDTGNIGALTGADWRTVRRTEFAVIFSDYLHQAEMAPHAA